MRVIFQTLLVLVLSLSYGLPVRLGVVKASAPVDLAAPEAAPDLIIQSITFSPANPAIGQATDITVTIKNQGDAAVSGTRVHLYINPSDEPPTTTTAHTATTFYGLPLGPGASFTFIRTGQTFANNGSQKVFAWVDRDNTVAESDETNNVLGPVIIPVGASVDAYEPDNTCAQATTIATDGTQQSHNLNPVGDVDWIKFDVIGGQKYRVKGISDGADADLSFELYAACDTPPSFGTDLEFIAPSNGTTHVKILHERASYGPNTQYRVQVTTESQCAAAYEPNNICGSAGDLAVNGAAQTHGFCQAGDVDWVKFPTAAGATYIVSSTNVGTDADVELSLYSTCSAVSGLPISQRLVFTAPSAGFVYLRAENQPTTTAGSTTSYTLQVAQQTTGCAQDAFEGAGGDNTPATASTLVVGTPQVNHTACPVGDVDWAKFSANVGVSYTIETQNLGPQADPVLCLYDSSGTTQLFCDDDSGPGNGARLTWQATTAGNYFVKVRDFNPQVSGSETRYDLSISTTACAPDAFEDDNTRATAKPLGVGSPPQQHGMCASASAAASQPVDEDWISFSATAGAYYVEAKSIGAEADTQLELYDSNNTRLANNDDFSPGTSARVVYTFTTPGTYFARARPFNPSHMGAGTEYELKVVAGLAPPPPDIQSPPPDSQPPPTTTMTGTQTIILVNLARFESVYGAGPAAALQTKLTALANHADVKGQIIRLDNNADVATAYSAWLAELSSPEKANLVTAAIRRVILNFLANNPSAQYVVLVGDDTMLPMRRIVDNTPRLDHLERDYTDVGTNYPAGAAIRGNYYLTDDYYADKEPTAYQDRELYIPDLAVGRLIETPTDITGFIDKFLANPSKAADKILVTGYDFVQDSGTAICDAWTADLSNGNTSPMDCALIGSAWPLADFKIKQLSTAFSVQSINGHANHYAEGAPGSGNSIKASEILVAAADYTGDLIYTMGCHSGLNVPTTEANNPLDLAEAFARRGANYVGNTGFGWGLVGNIGLSETMMKLYTEELRRGTSSRMGSALSKSKQRYYQQTQNFTGYDEKVMQQLIFYGLPMYGLQTGATLSLDDPFPSINFEAPAPAQGFPGTPTVVSSTLSLSLKRPLTPTASSFGSAYLVDGSGSAVADTPVQPLVYGSLSGEDSGSSRPPARSVLFLGGTFTVVNGFDPVVASPYNEYVSSTAESQLDAKSAQWYPATLLSIRASEKNANVVAELGQFQPLNNTQLVLSNVQADVYYSDITTDTTKPRIVVVDALYNPASNIVQVKVGATDESGVTRVLVSYATTNGNTGTWSSVNLRFNPTSQKWQGTFPGNANTRYFVQAVDASGNSEVSNNKAVYYTPAPSSEVSGNRVFLPLLRK